MLARGDRSHDVASWFGVNPGRVAEIATRQKFAEVAIACDSDLPPPGPYLAPIASGASLDAIAVARAALVQAEQLIASL